MVPMPKLPAKVLLPDPVWVMSPDVKVRFLPDAMVVSPFIDTAPVPVESVPVPDIVKLPEDWVYPVSPDIAPEVKVAVPSVMDVPCTAPVDVIAPLPMVPTEDKLPEEKPQLPERVPSVMVLVPKFRVPPRYRLFHS